MDKFGSVNQGGLTLVSVRAYQGDAMTLLAFDLDPSKLENFVGFTIQAQQGHRKPFYLYNRLSFSQDILDQNGIDDQDKLSTLYSPIQRFRWVHVPNEKYFGAYTYRVTPRYLVGGILQPLDNSLTASVTIDVVPFATGSIKVGFARAFISSEAYVDHFGLNSNLRPDGQNLFFNTSQQSGIAQRWNAGTKSYDAVPYTYLDQYEYLGWQARDRILEFLDEVKADTTTSLDVFAYDLDEPLIAEKLKDLAALGRLRVILDNSSDHTSAGCSEEQFAALFQAPPLDPGAIFRGRYKALAHSKVFIQSRGAQALKVLTGSTNFSINGLSVNANHVIIFDNPQVAQQYADVFDKSFGKNLMANFDDTALANSDFCPNDPALPQMTIRFSPHPQAVVDTYFKKISDRIDGAKSDVLFAIMDDRSKSGILDAVHRQVANDAVFTYGIVDVSKEVSVYKPGSKRGVRVKAKGAETVLPPPFNEIPKIPGIGIHHKFIVVDFKGADSVVYCGSSNLAYTPEQRNGDNLLEIHDNDIVTAFAVEAIRLVDHFHWRNRAQVADNKGQPLCLDGLKDKTKLWYKSYYDDTDLHSLERTLLIREKTTPE